MEHNCLKVNELALQLAQSLQNSKVSTADPLKKRTSSYRGLSSEPIITEEEPTIKGDYNRFYSQSSDKQVLDNKPWLQDGNYFKTVYISTIALLKMMSHARSGGSIEIMGMLTGKVFANTLVVMDCYLLPVEGTETRVNAQAEGYEFMVSYLDNLKEIKHNENIIGWYHSHPGYGCWLSGIDVATQNLNQKFQDPYLAIVIDPERSVRQGFVEIGAFRTFAEPAVGRSSSSVSSASGAGISDVAFSSGRNSASGMSSVLSASNISIAEELSKQSITQNVFDRTTTKIPKGKMTDFGAHSGKYYSLEVKVFRSPLEEKLLDTFGSKTWIKGLTNYSNVVNAEETQVELMHKIMEATENLRKESPSKLPSLVMGNLIYSGASQGTTGNRKRSMSKSSIYSGLQASSGIPSSRYPTKGKNMSGSQFNDDPLARSLDKIPPDSPDQQYDGALSIQQPKRAYNTHTSRAGGLASVLSSGSMDPQSYSMVGRMSLTNQSPGTALRGLNTPPNKRPQRNPGHTSSGQGGTPGGVSRSKEKINKPIGISMISKDFKVVISQQVNQMLRRHVQNDLFGSNSP